jgi:large subunit ribosomal protein L34e
MPQPHLRTRSKKRLNVSSPGGQRLVHYRARKPFRQSCEVCGRPLGGKSRLTAREVGRLNRTKKVIWRPYGGQVCASCLKNALRQAARTR